MSTIVTALGSSAVHVFGSESGKARGRYGVKAPAINRQRNLRTVFSRPAKYLGTLIVFLPGLTSSSHYLNPLVAAGLGAVYSSAGKSTPPLSETAGETRGRYGLTFPPHRHSDPWRLFGAVRQLLGH